MIYLFSFNHGLDAYPIAQQKGNTTIRYWHYFYKKIRSANYICQINTQFNPHRYSKLKIINDDLIEYLCAVESLDYVLPNILIEEDFKCGNLHLCELVQKHLFRIISESL